jgi:hypothetical protein
MNALTILLFSIKGLASCMPASIHQNLFTKKANIQLDQAVEKTATNFSDYYSKVIKKKLRKELVINLLPLDARLNAEATRGEKEYVINIYGGLLGHNKMTPAVMNLLLCHEMGHILGGEPLRSNKGWSSTEGQADYYSAYTCAHNLGFTTNDFYQAAIELVSIYAEITNDVPPRMDQMDDTEVERINYGYPKAQCRYDTLVSGWNKDLRPRCWFID